MKNKDLIAGILLALSGSLLFSTKAIFVKLAYRYEVDSISLLLLRMAFALPFYLAMLVLAYPREKSRWAKISRRHWFGLTLAAGLGFYLSSLMDFLGLQFIEASIERLILFIYPTFIAIMTIVFFKEKFSRMQIVALSLSYLGLLFVFGRHLDDLSLTSDFWKGAFLILGCAITYATFLVMSQWLIPSFGATSFTSICMTLASLFVGCHFLISGKISHLFSLPGPVYGFAMAMAFAGTVIPSYLTNYAIQRIGASRVGILSNIGPVSTISMAYILLGERLFYGQILGALLILTGVTLVSLEMKRK